MLMILSLSFSTVLDSTDSFKLKMNIYSKQLHSQSVRATKSQNTFIGIEIFTALLATTCVYVVYSRCSLLTRADELNSFIQGLIVLSH